MRSAPKAPQEVVPESTLSRRRFLPRAGAGAAVGAVGAVRAAEAGAAPGRRSQEVRTDVVVVGGGMGGLTAAVRARQQGADVVLIEKAFEPGGTSRSRTSWRGPSSEGAPRSCSRRGCWAS